LRSTGIRVSLFIDAEPATIEAATRLGVEAIELHTGRYAELWKDRHRNDGARALAEELTRLRRAAAQGRALGLAVHAGHGLTYENVAPVAAMQDIEELIIGHSVVSRAVLVGMERAVAEMRAIVMAARRQSNAA